jgi:hypothetical protein
MAPGRGSRIGYEPQAAARRELHQAAQAGRSGQDFQAFTGPVAGPQHFSRRLAFGKRKTLIDDE